MSLHRVCCCKLEGDCPCHSYYGGQATYTATWTGSVTATQASCSCLLSLYGPAPGDPATFADYVKPGETWTGQAVTVSWVSNDPLNANFCTLSGSTALSDITLQEAQLYDGACTDNGSPYNLATTLSYSVLAPDPDSGRNYWEADVQMTGLIRIKFRSTQQTCHPTVWSVYSVVTAPPSGCADFRGVASWSYTTGTFSLV